MIRLELYFYDKSAWQGSCGVCYATVTVTKEMIINAKDNEMACSTCGHLQLIARADGGNICLGS